MYGMDEKLILDENLTPEIVARQTVTIMLGWMERDEAVAVLVESLTQLGVVVVYTDDTVKRRENPELQPDTPLPSKK